MGSFHLFLRLDLLCLHPPIKRFGRKVTSGGNTMISSRARTMEPINGTRYLNDDS